jgi:hypothetical protein
MTPDLRTTNLLLGILAAVSLLKAFAVVAFVLAGFLLYRRTRDGLRGIEKRQVPPAAARAHAILADLKAVMSTVKASRLGRLAVRAFQWVRR